MCWKRSIACCVALPQSESMVLLRETGLLSLLLPEVADMLGSRPMALDPLPDDAR